MRCHLCGSAFIERTWGSCTMMGTHAPPGHLHDGNNHGAAFRCANGHVVYIERQNKCDKCAWVSSQQTFQGGRTELPVAFVDAFPEAGQGMDPGVFFKKGKV